MNCENVIIRNKRTMIFLFRIENKAVYEVDKQNNFSKSCYLSFARYFIKEILLHLVVAWYDKLKTFIFVFGEVFAKFLISFSNILTNTRMKIIKKR